jgi:hypothetical protein
MPTLRVLEDGRPRFLEGSTTPLIVEGAAPTNAVLREDSSYELREDGSLILRET